MTIKDQDIEDSISFINKDYMGWFPDPYPDSPDVRNLVWKLTVILIVVSIVLCVIFYINYDIIRMLICWNTDNSYN